MSNLKTALGAVKMGLNFEENQQEIQKAIVAYEEAISHFHEAKKLNEIKGEKLRQELDEQLKFYSDKVENLKSQVKINQCSNPPEDDELLRRIEATVIIERPQTRFADVAGLEEVKKSLKQAVVLPIKHPELFDDDLDSYKGFLFFGVSLLRYFKIIFTHYTLKLLLKSILIFLILFYSFLLSN